MQTDKVKELEKHTIKWYIIHEYYKKKLFFVIIYTIYNVLNLLLFTIALNQLIRIKTVSI